MLKIMENKYLMYILGIILFFSLFRYKGYDYDAALYLLQVINYLHPERFVNDVPFMFGNQDSFSIFSPIIAIVFKVLGVNCGGIVVTLFILLALVIAIVTLIRRWLKLFNAEQWQTPVVLAIFIILLGKEYGSGSFYMDLFEPYLVARVFAEVLIVVGLAFFFSKNIYISLITFIFATLMHPLMGGWTLPLWLFFHFPKFRAPILIISLFAPLSGFLHIGRLDFYPDDWKPLYYSPGWKEFVSYLGLLIFWLTMHKHFKEGLPSKFAISLFYVSLIGFYWQFIGSYTEHLLLYQAQPFRVQWLCTIPTIPFFALYLHNSIKKNQKATIQDYATFSLGLCTIAGYQWFVLIAITVLVVFNTLGKKNIVAMPCTWEKTLFVLSFLFLLTNSALKNFIQLTMEQGLGNMELALAWLNAPPILDSVEHILLMLLVLRCLSKKRYGHTLIFALAFCNTNLRVLPLIGVFLLLFSTLKPASKKLLLSFAISFSFIELLNSTYRIGSTEIMPLEDAAIPSLILFAILFVFIFKIMQSHNNLSKLKTLIPFFILGLSLSIWDIYRWDSRNESIAVNEKQMDSFFNETIFPQVKDRGKLLFTIDRESPTQSRINFLTGAYADESIYVGEVFYKKQFFESNRRRSVLLRGDDKPADMAYFGHKIWEVYSNPDTLLSRVNYLCQAKEITHFATDYTSMPLPRLDSIFLEKKQKNIILYGCP